MLTIVQMMNRGSKGKIKKIIWSGRWKESWIDGGTGGSEKRDNRCLMDVEGCGVLSVNDERIWCSAVPAELFLLIFPWSLIDGSYR